MPDIKVQEENGGYKKYGVLKIMILQFITGKLIWERFDNILVEEVNTDHGSFSKRRMEDIKKYGVLKIIRDYYSLLQEN